jgi:hypothetical protein
MSSFGPNGVSTLLLRLSIDSARIAGTPAEEPDRFERFHRKVDQFVKATSKALIMSGNDASTLSGMPNAPLASWATKPWSAERYMRMACTASTPSIP